ncbi:hypothetical protein [Fusobacterium varium]
MTNEVTIYVMFTPLKTVAHAYVNEQDVKEEMVNIFLSSGEKYSYELCSLKIDSEFVQRLNLLLSGKKIKK